MILPRPSSTTAARVARCALLAILVGWSLGIEVRGEGPLLAVFTDGSRVEGTKLEGWFDPDGKATEIKLGGRNLLDAGNPVRFIRDNDLAIKAPTAWLEMTGGDMVPGRIEGVQPGGMDGQLSQVLIALETPLLAPGAPRGYLPIRAERIARVVGRPGSRLPLRSGQLQYLDGRIAEFRAVRWTAEGLRLLSDAGVTVVRYSEIAEVALPLKDAAEGPVADSRWAAACGQTWLMRLETAGGAILTAPPSIRDSHRMQGRDRRGKTISEMEIEYVQPSWALAAIRSPADQAAIRGFRRLNEIPVSLLPAETLARKAIVGVATPWQRNRSLRGSYLAIGDRQGDLGMAIPSYSEVAFDLPPGVKEFRGWVGLDRGMGSGGCAQARVLRDQASGAPLWQSGFIQGKDAAAQIGPLPVAGAKRLIFITDFGHQGRPAGADPLDIRDELVWLSPTLSLDNPAFESPRSWQRLAAGLEDWQFDDAPAAATKASVRWSLGEERWDTILAPPDAGIALRRTQRITAHEKDVLELSLAVAAANASQHIPQLLAAIELKVDGEVVAPLCDSENPLRWSEALTHYGVTASLKRLSRDNRFQAIAPVSIWWDLQKYRGREVALSLTLKKPAGPELRWRELKLRGAAAIKPEEWPNPQVLLTGLTPSSVSSHKDRGHPAADKSPFKPIRDLTFLGQSVRGGFGMMRNSHLTFDLKPEYKRFVALVGTCTGKVGAYRILLDGKPAVTIPFLESTQPAERIDLAIPPGTKQLTLEVGEMGGYNGFGAFAPAGFVTE